MVPQANSRTPRILTAPPKRCSNEITFSTSSKGNFPKVEEVEEEDKILSVGNRG